MREYEGPGTAAVAQGSQWNIENYVDSAILARAKMLLFMLRVSGQNYLNAVYLPSSSVTQFDLERHNNMGAASSSSPLTDHVYHVFFNYDPSTHILTAENCFEYNVELTFTNDYDITSINRSAWSDIIFTFPHIYVFYQ